MFLAGDTGRCSRRRPAACRPLASQDGNVVISVTLFRLVTEPRARERTANENGKAEEDGRRTGSRGMKSRLWGMETEQKVDTSGRSGTRRGMKVRVNEKDIEGARYVI